MASAHIDVTGTASRLSAEVRRAVDDLAALQGTWQEIKNVMDQVAYGGDYAALGTYLGVTAGEAESIYNMWGSSNAEIRATFLAQVQARLG